MKGALLACCVLLLAGCASAPLPSADEAPPLPEALAQARDLRGPFRAAFCGREGIDDAACGRTLWRFAGERAAPRPPAADPARYRLVFVPGFLASCFPEIHSFADAMEAARAQGYAVEFVNVEGRNGVEANARDLARRVDALPPDGRRLVFVTHSKGAPDALQMLADRPDVGRRTAAVLSLAGALAGSPLADRLHGLYAVTFGAFPFSACAAGEGDAVADLARERRKAWWRTHGASLTVPVYALVSVPEMERLSPLLYPPFLLLARDSRYNDGMLLAEGQVVPAAALLGVVNADHLAIGIPRPDAFPYSAWFTPIPFPRAEALLAALDVIAADAP